jgi:hypothetical protein
MYNLLGNSAYFNNSKNHIAKIKDETGESLCGRHLSDLWMYVTMDGREDSAPKLFTKNELLIKPNICKPCLKKLFK